MSEKIGYKDIFRQKEFMKMIIAGLINRFGDSIDAIASTWIVYEITGSAAWSAIIFGVNKIPSILLSPLAGAWVEGRNKKRIMVMTDIIRALCVALVATGYLCGFLQAWMLLLTSVTISTAEAFRIPADTALTPRVLEEKYYEYGMALSSTLSSIVELIGMAIAAGIIALIGTAGAIYVDVATFLMSAGIIALVNTKEQDLQKQKFDAKEYMATFRDGLVYVKKERAILFFCGIAVFLNSILVPFNSLQAPLTNEILGGGAEVLSILGISLTVGMMLGTMFYPMLSKALKSRAIVALCCVGISLYYIGLIVCKPLYDSAVFMYAYVTVSSFITGAVVSLFMTFLSVEFIRKLDEAYLARAAGVMESLSVAAVPVTAMLVSALAAFVSTEWLFVVAGAVGLLACPLFLKSRVLDEQPDTEGAELEEQVAIAEEAATLPEEM